MARRVRTDWLFILWQYSLLGWSAMLLPEWIWPWWSGEIWVFWYTSGVMFIYFWFAKHAIKCAISEPTAPRTAKQLTIAAYVSGLCGVLVAPYNIGAIILLASVIAFGTFMRPFRALFTVVFFLLGIAVTGYLFYGEHDSWRAISGHFYPLTLIAGGLAYYNLRHAAAVKNRMENDKLVCLRKL